MTRIQKLLFLKLSGAIGGAWATIKGIIAHFTDGTANPLRSLKAFIDPVQDLHGQSSPYPAGGGVNLFNPDTAEELTINGQTRWGHYYTEAGTYACKAYGTAETGDYIYARVKNADDSWESSKYLVVDTSIYNNVIVTITSGQTLYVYDASGAGQSDVIARFQRTKTQVALSSTQPSEYHPYSNICPITGHTGVNVTVAGVNLFDKENIDNVGTHSYISGGGVLTSGSYEYTFKIKLSAGTYSIRKRNVSSSTIRLAKFTSEPQIGDTGTMLLNVYGTSDIVSGTFTLTEPSWVACFYYNGTINDGDYDECIATIQLAYGEDTTYHAYTGQTYSVQFPTMGKNIIDVTSWLNSLGISYTVDNDGWYVCVSLSGSSGGLFANPYEFADTKHRSLLLLLDTTRTTATNVRARMLRDGTLISETSTGNPSSATLEDKYANKISFNFGSNGSVCFKLMVVDEATAPTAYEPYTNTVYSGTLDVVSGELVVDKAMVTFDGTEIYDNTYFPSVVCLKELATGSGDGNGFVNSFAPSSTDYANYSNSTKRIMQFSHCDVVWGVASANELKAKIAELYANGTPVQICYPLATPITYQLTPTEVTSLLGVNNIWSSTGEVEVTYKKQ